MFPLAVITNSHKPLTSKSGALKSSTSRCLRASVSFQSTRKRSDSLPFPASPSHPHPLPPGPFLQLQSQEGSIFLIIFSPVTSPLTIRGQFPKSRALSRPACPNCLATVGLKSKVVLPLKTNPKNLRGAQKEEMPAHNISYRPSRILHA